MDYFRTLNQFSPIAKSFLVLYFLRAISGGLAFFIGIYLAHIHMKWTLIGYEVSALTAGNLLGAWVSARISDKMNPMTLSGISMVLQGSCFFLIAFSISPIVLSLTIFIYGFAAYLYIAVNHFILTSIAGGASQERAQFISFTSIASNLGLMFGGILVSFLTKEHAAFVFSCTGLMLIGLSFFYFRHRSHAETIKTSNQSDLTQPDERIYIIALISTFLVGAIFAQQRIGYQIFLENHFSGLQISTILVVNTLMIVLLLPSLSKTITGNEPVKHLAIGGLLLGVGMYLTILSSNYVFILLLCIFRTVGEMMAILLSQYLCFQYSPKNARGRAMGSHKFVFALGILMGSLVGTNLLSQFGMNSVWLLCGLLGVLIVLTCLPVIKSNVWQIASS